MLVERDVPLRVDPAGGRAGQWRQRRAVTAPSADSTPRMGSGDHRRPAAGLLASGDADGRELDCCN